MLRNSYLRKFKRRNNCFILILLITFCTFLFSNFSSKLFILSKDDTLPDLSQTDDFCIIGNEELALYCNNTDYDGNSWETAYIIENITFSAPLFYIAFTNKYLIIRNCTVIHYGFLEECYNIKITNCSMNEGIYIYGGINIRIINCSFYNCNAGLYFCVELFFASQCIISDNLIDKSQSGGIYIYGDNNTINRNKIINGNEDGIYISISSKYNNVSNNMIQFNNGNGIQVEGYFNYLENNHVSYNKGDGIQFLMKFIDWNFYSTSNDNTVSNNNISFNGANGLRLMGIYSEREFHGVESNKIYNNYIGYNNECGILLEYPAHDNEIVNNTFDSNQEFCIKDQGYNNIYLGNKNCTIFYDPYVFDRFIVISGFEYHFIGVSLLIIVFIIKRRIIKNIK